MFNNHKIELRLKKDTEDGVVDRTPSITKDELIEISKKTVKYVVGGILLVLATSAVLDTGKYAVMCGIENKSDKEED
jgi:hypothetical protein